jgi:hypothetical protein
MALVLADRVKETTTTTGTGTVTLAGAAAGFQSFAVVGNANTTYYTITDSVNGTWEVGIGTYTAAGTLLSRDTVLSSSNAGSLVNFAAGTKDVFVTYPAGRSIYADGTTLQTTNSAILPIVSGGTGASTRQNAMDALAGSTTSGQYLRGNGTDVVMAAIVAADVPTLNQNTTGSAATLTTGRTIAVTGDLAYTSSSFNGSANVTGAGTLATVNSNVGSFGSSTVIPVITVNGKGLVTAVSTATSVGIRGVRVTTILTSQTYTKPSDTAQIIVFVLGATGGAPTSTTARGGNGGGGYSEKYYSSPSASYVVTIGAAGAATGGAGGTTSIDVLSVTGSAGVTTGTGGAGGVGSGGTFNGTGGTGGNGRGTGFGGSGGGGGAGAGRAGNGFAGGNGSPTSNGGGGGGGGSGGAGSVAPSVDGGAGGAGGVAATTTSASATNMSPYISPPSAVNSFLAGSNGFPGSAGVNGGIGGDGAAGTSSNAGVFGLSVPGGPGGQGGYNEAYDSANRAGVAGKVIIWELLG